MILIISEEDDHITDRVIDWLKHYEVPFLRINNANHFDVEKVEMDASGKINGILKSGNYTLQLSSIKGYWYRRGKISFRIKSVGPQQKKGLQGITNRYLEKEYTAIAEMIYHYLHALPLSIGNIAQNATNKLVNLKIAKDCGVHIPQSWIVSSRNEVLQLLKAKQQLLTKTVTQGGLYYEDSSIKFDGFSNMVTIADAKKFEETFAPTLFQSYIDKAYEIRIFYFSGECYASAIFSQLDEMTRVDFRNYNYNRPNRTPPFRVPAELKKKIDMFMKKVNMKSGSLDILAGKDKQFYFLEVNPVGQFYQVSYPCNYYLEKRIAQYFKHGH